jgi:hypothetical protein
MRFSYAIKTDEVFGTDTIPTAMIIGALVNSAGRKGQTTYEGLIAAASDQLQTMLSMLT